MLSFCWCVDGALCASVTFSASISNTAAFKQANESDRKNHDINEEIVSVSNAARARELPNQFEAMLNLRHSRGVLEISKIIDEEQSQTTC